MIIACELIALEVAKGGVGHGSLSALALNSGRMQGLVVLVEG